MNNTGVPKERISMYKIPFFSCRIYDSWRQIRACKFHDQRNRRAKEVNTLKFSIKKILSLFKRPLFFIRRSCGNLFFQNKNFYVNDIGNLKQLLLLSRKGNSITYGYIKVLKDLKRDDQWTEPESMTFLVLTFKKCRLFINVPCNVPFRSFSCFQRQWRHLLHKISITGWVVL